MNENNSVVLGIGAMLALLVSLPLEWMMIHNGTMQFTGGFQGFGGGMPGSLGGMSLAITGFNGHITLLVKLPIWLIVIAGLTGALLAILNDRGVTTLPKFVPLLFLCLSSVYVVAAMLVAIGSSSASVGIGPFVALIGLAMGLVLALTSRSNQKYHN